MYAEFEHFQLLLPPLFSHPSPKTLSPTIPLSFLFEPMSSISFIHSFTHYTAMMRLLICGRACANSCIKLSILCDLHLQSRTFKQGYTLKRSGMFKIMDKHLYGWKVVISVFVFSPLKRTHELLGACDSSVNVTQFSITQEGNRDDGFMGLLGNFLDCINWGGRTCPLWVASFPRNRDL